MKRVRHIKAQNDYYKANLTLEITSNGMPLRKSVIDRTDEIAGLLMMALYKAGFPLTHIKQK